MANGDTPQSTGIGKGAAQVLDIGPSQRAVQKAGDAEQAKAKARQAVEQKKQAVMDELQGRMPELDNYELFNMRDSEAFQQEYENIKKKYQGQWEKMAKDPSLQMKYFNEVRTLASKARRSDEEKEIAKEIRKRMDDENYEKIYSPGQKELHEKFQVNSFGKIEAGELKKIEKKYGMDFNNVSEDTPDDELVDIPIEEALAPEGDIPHAEDMAWGWTNDGKLYLDEDKIERGDVTTFSEAFKEEEFRNFLLKRYETDSEFKASVRKTYTDLVEGGTPEAAIESIVDQTKRRYNEKYQRLEDEDDGSGSGNLRDGKYKSEALSFDRVPEDWPVPIIKPPDKTEKIIRLYEGKGAPEGLTINDGFNSYRGEVHGLYKDSFSGKWKVNMLVDETNGRKVRTTPSSDMDDLIDDEGNIVKGSDRLYRGKRPMQIGVNKSVMADIRAQLGIEDLDEHYRELTKENTEGGNEDEGSAEIDALFE